MLDRDKTNLLTYQAVLGREVEIMARYKQYTNYPIICLIDIDLFKKYNTELGYEGADRKLRELADKFRKLEESAKEYECIRKLHSCHMSGDEFLLVFETDLENDHKERAKALNSV